MSAEPSAQPGYRKYSQLVADIESGVIRIPTFQRDFVWNLQKSAVLIDSMLKGYPVGTLIFWRTTDRLPGVRSIGGVDLKEGHEMGFVQYVLDGQQRLSSMFAIMEGGTVEKDGRNVDYKDIFVSLDAPPDSDNIVSAEKPQGASITVYDLLHKDFDEMVEEYSGHAKKISDFQHAIKGYSFSTIMIEGYPIEKAVDVFSRINTTGKSLTLFDIMVAKTYDEGSFDLRERHRELQESLQDVLYEVPGAQLLQCVSLSLKRVCKRGTILELKKGDIQDQWEPVASAIRKAVDHFRKSHAIPSWKLLPYPALLVPFSYFFLKNPGAPTALQDRYLKEYFWRAALTSRFNNSAESKLASDCKIIDEIVGGRRPSYGKDLEVTLGARDIAELQFGSDAISKSVLCVLASTGPRSFKNGAAVSLDDANLSKSNSKNSHHFFPKAFLKKRGVAKSKINRIANITFMDAGTNKNEIRDRAPSEYVRAFSKDNPDLAETMETHLIGDLAEYGVLDNDYDRFIEMRSKAIWEKLSAGLDPDP